MKLRVTWATGVVDTLTGITRIAPTSKERPGVIVESGMFVATFHWKSVSGLTDLITKMEILP